MQHSVLNTDSEWEQVMDLNEKVTFSALSIHGPVMKSQIFPAHKSRSQSVQSEMFDAQADFSASLERNRMACRWQDTTK